MAMKTTAQQIFFPFVSTYQQHGLKTAAPIAFIFLTAISTLSYAISQQSVLLFSVALTLWCSSTVFSLLTTHSPRKAIKTVNDPYDEDPLAAVQAALNGTPIKSKTRHTKIRHTLPAYSIAH